MPEKDERSLEQVYHSAVSGLYARLKSNYDFIYRRYGDEGLELITEMSREYGLSIAERARNSLKNNELDAVAGYILRIFDTISRNKKEGILSCEINDRRAVITVNDCPLHFTDPRMCRAHTMMEKTVVEEINPRLTYRVGKSIPVGDAYCEHIIEFQTPEQT